MLYQLFYFFESFVQLVLLNLGLVTPSAIKGYGDFVRLRN